MRNFSIQKSFFGKLYLRSKKLFLLCLLIGLSWLLPAIIGFEVTPFYDWSMYAYPQLPRDTFEVTVLRYNAKEAYRPPFAPSDHRRMLITYTLPHYADGLHRGDSGTYKTRTAALLQSLFRAGGKRSPHNSAAAYAAYPGWLAQYLSRQIDRPVSALHAVSYRCVYTPDFRLKPVGAFYLF